MDWLPCTSDRLSASLSTYTSIKVGTSGPDMCLHIWKLRQGSWGVASLACISSHDGKHRQVWQRDMPCGGVHQKPSWPCLQEGDAAAEEAVGSQQPAVHHERRRADPGAEHGRLLRRLQAVRPGPPGLLLRLRPGRARLRYALRPENCSRVSIISSASHIKLCCSAWHSTTAWHLATLNARPA